MWKLILPSATTALSIKLLFLGLLLLVSTLQGQIARAPVQLPLTSVSGPQANVRALQLAFRQGGTDELPEGPQSFDVLGDGVLLVNDPLHMRIAAFRGRVMIGAQLLPFPVDRINLNADGVLEVRNAQSQQLKTLGFEVAGVSRENIPRRDFSGRARLMSPVAGEITGLRGGEPPVLHVTSAKSQGPLLSLRRLPSDDGFIYVLLQFQISWSPIHIRKVVRKYSKADRSLCEFEANSEPQFFAPLDEFRVVQNTVYQMFSTPKNLSVFSWETRDCR